jgi:hypothetical protein
MLTHISQHHGFSMEQIEVAPCRFFRLWGPSQAVKVKRQLWKALF